MEILVNLLIQVIIIGFSKDLKILKYKYNKYDEVVLCDCDSRLG